MAHRTTRIRSHAPVGGQPAAGQPSGRAGPVDSVEAAWQELDEALAAYADRFIGFRSVRLDRPSAEILAAVEQDVVGRGFRGIGELTPPPGRADLLEPVLQAASDFARLPAVIHGSAPTTERDIATIAELAGRNPNVPIVISQLGGAHWLTAVEVALATPNLYLDLSTASVIFAVRLAIKELPDRTLFGSDGPYGDPTVARLTIERVTKPGSVRDRVLGDTMAELLAK